MVEKVDWILNKLPDGRLGESPYDMVRRGKEVPLHINKEASRIGLFMPQPEHDSDECRVQPLFPELKVVDSIDRHF